MRLRGRRLTVVLTIVLFVILGGGASAAWALGKTRATPMPLGYSAGPTDVQTMQMSSSANQHPRADDVRRTLQGYFEAINRKDFDAWTTVVAADQSASQTAGDWNHKYSTTVDSNLMVVDIRDDPLRARLMFTSEQDVELAPKRLPVECINWDLTFLLTDQDGALVLSGIDPSAQSMTACQ
ncbi:MAG TPA: hypothetical protein VIU11_20245 [Nakamurella sp.]